MIQQLHPCLSKGFCKVLCYMQKVLFSKEQDQAQTLLV